MKTRSAIVAKLRQSIAERSKLEAIPRSSDQYNNIKIAVEKDMLNDEIRILMWVLGH